MQTTKPADRLLYDEDGKLDDLWQTGVDVHIERMGKRRYWGALYFPDGTRITLSFDNASIIEERIRESSRLEKES